MTTVLAPPLAPTTQPARRTRGFAGTAVVLGLVAFLVSAAGSWQPSYWGDEAASVLSAERSFPSLVRMLGHVDAVHGVYYVLLHGWIDLFGASEFATRLPSALAIGVAAAGTAVLARMLATTRVAVLAAVVFAVLPRVTYMGAEARSTALATMIAVWATVLLVHIVRTRAAPPLLRLGLWAGYAGMLAAGIYVFLYTVLLLPVHAVAVLLLTRRRRRRGLFVWAGTAAGALAAAAPVLYWGISQRDQISFLARRPAVGLLDAAVDQWFATPALAALAWALIVVGSVAVFVPRFRQGAAGARVAAGERRKSETGSTADDRVGAQVTMLAWLLVPSAVLLIGTHLIAPMYTLRYLSICTPAAAILVAVGAASLRPRWAPATALLLVVGLAAPPYLSQRTDFAKDGGSDWRQVADILHTEARASDAIVFDESTRPSRRPRLAMYLYPAAFVGLVDVTLDRPFEAGSGLWDTTLPLAGVTSRLADTDRVWLLQNRGSAEAKAGTDVAVLQQLGFTEASAQTVNRTIIIELTR